MYFQSIVTTFAELAHKCRYQRELHTSLKQNRRQKVVTRGLYVCAGGTLRSCRAGGLEIQIWLKFHEFIVFHISIWWLGAFFGGAKRTKAPPWRRDLSEMDMNYQQLCLRLSHFSVLVGQNSLLKSFVWIVFCIWAIRNAFAFHKLPNIHFCEHFLQISHNLRTINAQINIRGKNNTKVRHSRKVVSLYLNTTIGQLKNLLEAEHKAGVKTKQINYENSPCGEYSFALSTSLND